MAAKLIRRRILLGVAKIAEGGSYRVFEVSFKNKEAAIIRLPYPCTVPRNYGIASEVATIEYLRLHGVPIPRILAWSSTTSNRLGCEYIVMEKARGKELQEVWYIMGHAERKLITAKIVAIESLLFKIWFPASGSYTSRTLSQTM
jgi:predicted Ser/Thr protein kinase